MSEKQQHTAERTRESMLARYGDEHHHKHDKRHTPYRLHCRSHTEQHANGMLQHEKINGYHQPGEIKIFQKSRKQLEKIMFH